MMKKWKKLIEIANHNGVPMPMVRDPKTRVGSVSLTLVFLSFNLWIVSIVGKWSGYFGGIDPSQTMNMVVICFGLYFGRKFQKDGSNITVDAPNDNKDSK